MNISSVLLPDYAETAMAYYSQQPRKLWGRRLAILNLFFSFSILLVWDWLTGRLSANQQIRACTLRDKLVEMGPTFIKLGQVLSCRPDLIPPIYVQELANLQDQLPPFSNEKAYQVIEEELGCPYDQIYAELNPDPIAAASLGQVYKGRLKTGEIVAVKVQRPELIHQIALDIYLLCQLAAWAQKNISFMHSDLVALSDEVAVRLFAETDYIQEGTNAQKFAQLYNNLHHIYVPSIHWKYTRRRVLTMEWIDGIKLTSTDRILAQGLEPADLISVGFKFSLQQLLEGGFFHADPHPGNVLITWDGKLAYLDFGMMSHVEPETCDRLIISLLHLISGDFTALAQDYVLLGFLPPDTDLAPLAPRLARIFGNIRESSIAEFGFKQSFEKLLDLIYEYSWQIPAFYLLVFRSFATLEGIVLNINPNFKAYKVGYAYIAQWLLTKRSPVLWDALEKFSLKNQTIQWDVVGDLLENIYQSDDLNVNHLLESLLIFLYSPQGKSLRYVLVNEAATRVEHISQDTFDSVVAWTGSIISPFPTFRPTNSLQDLQKLLDQLLHVVPSDSLSLLDLSKLLLRPEAQRLGQEILSELARRIFRGWLPT